MNPENAINSTAVNHLMRTLNDGGAVVLSLAANHAVVVRSITITFNGNNELSKMTIRIMDPEFGNSRNLNFRFNSESGFRPFSDRVISAFSITK